MFSLDPRLKADTVSVAESTLNVLLLMNDRRYPWCILVPKVDNIIELYELQASDRLQLFEESHHLSMAMARAFNPDKMNIATLGNVVAQLHLHHVARRTTDPAWPGPVWGHSTSEPYETQALEATIAQLLSELGSTFEQSAHSTNGNKN